MPKLPNQQPNKQNNVSSKSALPSWINYYSTYSFIILLLDGYLNLKYLPCWFGGSIELCGDNWSMMIFLILFLIALFFSIAGFLLSLVATKSKIGVWFWWLINIPLFLLNAYNIFLVLANT